MNAWDIYSFQPPGWPEPHPAVIISHPLRVAGKPDVNVLMCSSQPATRPPRANEVLLDQADGLDWPSLCKCDLLHALPKAQLKEYRGHVTQQRRWQIICAINRSNGWGPTQGQG